MINGFEYRDNLPKCPERSDRWLSPSNDECERDDECEEDGEDGEDEESSEDGDGDEPSDDDQHSKNFRCVWQKISERAMRVWGGCKRRKNNALKILIAVGAVVLTIALIII